MSHILFAWGPLFEDTYVGRVLVHLPLWGPDDTAIWAFPH
jgi:hypothetical protein